MRRATPLLRAGRPGLRALLLVAFVLTTGSCDSSPVNPEEVGATQQSQTAQLASILAKLDSVEAKLDRQAVELAALRDQVAGGGSGDGTVLTGLSAAQLDSVLVLASFLAMDATSGGWEFCIGADLGGEFGIAWKGEGKAEAQGSLGAWAGTGGYGGAKAEGKQEVGGGIKVGTAGGVEGCVPASREEPPVRPAPVGPMRSAELDQLRTAVDEMRDRFNLEPARITQSLTNVGNAIASPGSVSLRTVGQGLPLPSALSTIASDPLATITSRIPEFASEALDLLCGEVNWGAHVSSAVSQACNLADSGGVDLGLLNSLSTTYPALQTTMISVCGRIDQIGAQRLTIPSRDLTILGTTYEVFPGYSARLFPNYTSPC